MVPGSSEVIRLRGQTADIVRLISSSSPPNLENPDAITELIRLGVLSRRGVSRRELVKAGAIGVGAGIGALTLPTAAIASSDQRTQLFGQIYWNDQLAGRLLFFQAPGKLSGENGFDPFLPPPDAVSETPSQLTVSGLGNLSLYVKNSSYAEWRHDPASTPWTAAEANNYFANLNLSDNPEGEFEWAGTLYSVTFSYIGDPYIVFGGGE